MLKQTLFVLTLLSFAVTTAQGPLRPRPVLPPKQKASPEEIIPLPQANPELLRQSSLTPRFRFAPIVFFATYGDNNQSFDNSSASIDKRGSYWWPTAFPGLTNSLSIDMDQVVHDHVYPYSISGYPAFNPSRVMEAKLRLDVYIQPNVSLWDNDTIGAWDNHASPGKEYIPLTSNTTFQKSLAPFLDKRRALNPHWVSIVFDLTPNAAGGGVYVYDIDKFGNPIPGRYWGMFTTITNAQQMAVLRAASDGNLQGWLQDDTPLSYAELMIKAGA